MKTFLLDIIPKIKRLSRRLDDTAVLVNQPWVMFDDNNQSKNVYYFRANSELLVVNNGVGERGKWEFLDNQTILIDIQNKILLLKSAFIDDKILALKLDSKSEYAVFLNENRIGIELNSLEDITDYLSETYLTKNNPYLTGGNKGLEAKKTVIYSDASYNGHKIPIHRLKTSKDIFDFAWGYHKVFEIKYDDGNSGKVYYGKSSQKYFIHHITFGI